MSNSLPLYVVLGLMVAAAVLTVITDRLLSAVVFAGALSAFAALGYLLLGAPDVALAEIVVGATLSTVIFLVTLKKYRIFTVYLTGPGEPDGDARISGAISRALKTRELEPHMLRAQEDAAVLLSRPGCDLVVEQDGNAIVLHREESSQYVKEIFASLEAEGFSVSLQDSLAQSATDYREGRA